MQPLKALAFLQALDVLYLVLRQKIAMGTVDAQAISHLVGKYLLVAREHHGLYSLAMQCCYGVGRVGFDLVAHHDVALILASDSNGDHRFGNVIQVSGIVHSMLFQQACCTHQPSLSADYGTQAIASDIFQVVDCHWSRLAIGDNGLGDGVGTGLLNGGHAGDLRIGQRLDMAHGKAPCGECPGLIKHDGIGPGYGIQIVAALEQDAAT